MKSRKSFLFTLPSAVDLVDAVQNLESKSLTVCNKSATESDYQKENIKEKLAK